ncbi:unnamed protein product [Rotaria magnacalcarata]|uniref:CWH43-like N-terminal domain-containing protein n=3 Tax=Rotaria magnacalcarata TaxID=392030 RepID=A0A816SSQ2_9BILA|nr:unnamed protein product [Rotaria magnacalcarata]
MTRAAALIWYWSLSILPFTAIVTFILTLTVCSQILNSISPLETYPPISLLGIGPAYYYFVCGFILLLSQFLIIVIGRVQFLCQYQSIIRYGLIYTIHAVAFVSCVFFLIMTVVSHDIHPHLHFIGAFGMFLLISVYCIFHTFVVFYLYAHRSKAPEHSNVILPLWFLACTVLLVIFFVVWIETHQSIPQYIAAGMPFLYFVGFVPQFWKQATTTTQTYCAPGSMHDPSEISV